MSKGFPTVTNALEGISAPQVTRTGGQLGLSTESGSIRLGGGAGEAPVINKGNVEPQVTAPREIEPQGEVTVPKPNAKTKSKLEGDVPSSIPSSATPQQINQIKDLLRKHNLDGDALALRKYFDKNKNNLGEAISKFNNYLKDPNPKLRNHGFANRSFTFDTPELKAKYPGLAKKYPNGVKFTKDGYPDFSSYTVPGGNVKIDMVGNYTTDFTDATRLARQNGISEEILTKIQKDYTWHHSEDMRTMQLVPLDLHRAVRHSGGISRIEILEKLSDGR